MIRSKLSSNRIGSGLFRVALLLSSTGLAQPSLAQNNASDSKDPSGSDTSASGLAASVPAQATSPEPAPSGDIVVTALRRSTSLQQTPLSVAAVGGKLLAEKGSVDFIDFASSVPGFTIRDNGPGQRRPVIRGIQGAGEAQVGTYYDEFPITSSPGATNDAGRFAPDIKLIDVDRVEVLRGPQGTLFGSGSEGGTLKVVTNKPNLQDWSGSLGAQTGFVSHGDPDLSLNGVVNVPIVNGALAVRAVGYSEHDGGYIDNVALKVNNINKVDTQGGRIEVRALPTSKLTIDLLALYQHMHADAGNAVTKSLGDLKANLAAYDPLNDNVQVYGATATWKTKFATFVGNFSYFKRDLDFNFLFPGAPIPHTSPLQTGNAIVQQPQTSDSKTYELRAQSPDNHSPLTWTIGAFEQNRDAYFRSFIPFTDATGHVTTSLPIYQDRSAKASLDQTAVYGDVSYTLWDKLTGSVGLRWFHYNVTSLQQTTIATNGVIPSNAGIYTGFPSFKQSGVLKKFELSYKVNRDIMLYALRSEGFRPGGANQNQSPVIPVGYGSDKTINYEGGVKSQWFNRRLTLNADYYHIIWNNLQVAGSTPDGLFRFTTNAGAAKVDGVEVELSGRPTDHLDLGLTYGYTNARLSKDQPFIPGVPRRGLAGDRIPAVPKNTVNFSAEQSFDVASDVVFRLRGEVQYVSGSQNNFHPTLTSATTGAETGVSDPFFAKYPGYTTFDFRGTVDFGRYNVQAFINNATDKRGVTYDFIDNFRPGGYTYYIHPRTIGLAANVKF